MSIYVPTRSYCSWEWRVINNFHRTLLRLMFMISLRTKEHTCRCVDSTEGENSQKMVQFREASKSRINVFWIFFESIGLLIMIIQIVIATTHVHITFLSHCTYFGRYACWIAIRVTERSELPIRWVWFLYFSYMYLPQPNSKKVYL